MGSLGTLPDPLDINDRTDTTITAADEIVYADATDSAAIKKDTVQGILDLAVVADNAITLAKMAGATDGNIISFDASGDPVYIATGSDGQVLTSAGAGAPPAFEALPAGGGKVLQCLSTTLTSSATNNNATFTTISGLTVAITPAATSSKILVMWHVNINGNNGGSGIQIVRGSTAICIGDAAGSRKRTTANTYTTLAPSQPNRAGQHLDSPSSTSAITYAVQWRSDGSQTDYLNRGEDDGDSTDYNRTASNITVMEIGA